MEPYMELLLIVLCPYLLFQAGLLIYNRLRKSSKRFAGVTHLDPEKQQPLASEEHGRIAQARVYRILALQVAT
jgi:hypothetical protein